MTMQQVHIKKLWSKDYEEQNLNTWSFDALEKWANKKDGEMKTKLLDAITIFKKKSFSH